MLQPKPVKKTVKKSIKKPVNKSLEGPQDAFKWSKGMPNLKPTMGDGKTVAKKGATIKKAQMGRLIKKGIEKAVPKIETTTIKNAVKSAGREDLKSKMKLWDKDLTKKKNGGSMKKCRYGCKQYDFW